MTEEQSKTAEKLIVAEFSGVYAISPEIYQQRIEHLAHMMNVECDDTFKKFVTEVLAKQPSMLD